MPTITINKQTECSNIVLTYIVLERVARFLILSMRNIYQIIWYCFGDYAYLFLIYFSFLNNVLFNADFKNAICFWPSHLVFEL